jgi:hypothetical protein
MKKYNDDDDMSNEYVSAAIRSMAGENPRLDGFMTDVASIAEKQQSFGAPNMPLNSILMKCMPVPRYVDPCIWACMARFAIGDQEWVEKFGSDPVCSSDFLTDLFNESVREVNVRLTWDPEKEEDAVGINDYGQFI